MSVSLIIVSHSARLAEGVAELVGQMNAGQVSVLPVGGTDDGTLGTSVTRIGQALEQALAQGGAALILMDLGSAYLSSTTALEFLTPEQRARVQLADAPLVEGAFLAAFEAAGGGTLDEVRAAAEEGRAMPKITG
ncbi:dihydroxyacetone kinase phosphoryl donor subunit DhaM [Deinococcus antarcticus]|uniref:phosphoenolpyruvate--glycerone phosphotransferase n=1 Tax=Deinococcus antarcticus TaxID=1298767 RepID=A0ABV8A692_9DEIO